MAKLGRNAMVESATVALGPFSMSSKEVRAAVMEDGGNFRVRYIDFKQVFRLSCIGTSLKC